MENRLVCFNKHELKEINFFVLDGGESIQSRL